MNAHDRGVTARCPFQEPSHILSLTRTSGPNQPHLFTLPVLSKTVSPVSCPVRPRNKPFPLLYRSFSMGRGIIPGDGAPWWVEDTVLPILCSVSALS